MQALPDDVIVANIAPKLQPADLVRVSHTNAAMRKLCMEGRDWLQVVSSVRVTHHIADGLAEHRELAGHCSPIKAIAFDGTNTYVAAGSVFSQVKVNAVRGGDAGMHPGHRRHVTAAKFTPVPDPVLITCSRDQTLCMWRPGGQGLFETLSGHTDAVTTLDIHRSGTWAISGGEDKTVRLWDLHTARQRDQLNGHSGIVYEVSLHPSGDLALSSSQDATACVWDLRDDRPAIVLAPRRGFIASSTFAPTSPQVLTSALGGALQWDLRKPASPSATFPSIGFYTVRVAYHSAGKELLAVARDNVLRVWSVDAPTKPLLTGAYRDWIESASFSPTTRHVLSASRDGNAHVRSLDDPDHAWQVASSPRGYSAAAFNHQGTHVALGSFDGSASLFDLVA